MIVEPIGLRNGELHCKVDRVPNDEEFTFTIRKGQYYGVLPNGVARIYQTVDNKKWYTRPEFNNKIFPHVVTCWLEDEKGPYLGYVTLKVARQLAKQLGYELAGKRVDGGMLYLIKKDPHE